MAGESSVVQINVSVQDAVPGVPDFGATLLVADVGGAWLGTREFTADADGLSSLSSDFGVSVGSTAYRILSAFASGQPAASRLKIYSRETPNAQVVELKVTITKPGHVYTLRVNGVEVSYTVESGDTVDDILTALAVDIDAVAGVKVTIDDDPGPATMLEIEPATTSDQRVVFSAVSKGITLKDTSTDAGIAAELANAILEDDDFQFIVLDSNSGAEILAADTWAAANKKIQLAHVIDSEALGSGSSVAKSLVTAASNATFVLVSRDTETQGVYSYFSSYSTFHPGTANIHMWTQGSGEALKITPTERANAITNRVGVLTNIGGVNTIFGGRLPSGRALATQQFTLYLEKMMQLDVLALFLTQPRVPFTPTGTFPR